MEAAPHGQVFRLGVEPRSEEGSAEDVDEDDEKEDGGSDEPAEEEWQEVRR